MRLNNRNKANYFHFLSTVVFMTVFGGIVLFLLEKYKFQYLGSSIYLILIFPLLLLLLFFIRGRQIFEYDSDGEALNFKNRNVILFLDKALSDEFPKYKLKEYEIVDAFFFKKLYITVFSKKSSSVILKYDISYLTKKELIDLKISLSKVIKANNDNKSEKLS